MRVLLACSALPALFKGPVHGKAQDETGGIFKVQWFGLQLSQLASSYFVWTVCVEEGRRQGVGEFGAA